MPSDPASLKAWVESLSRGELMALAQEMTSAAFTASLGSMGEFGPRKSQAHRGARATFDPLESMAGGFIALDPALLTKLARAALFGLTTSA